MMMMMTMMMATVADVEFVRELLINKQINMSVNK